MRSENISDHKMVVIKIQNRLACFFLYKRKFLVAVTSLLSKL